MSYQDMVAREVLSRIQVSSLVTRDSHAVRPDISIGSFVSGYVLTHHDRCYPVMEDEELVGLICLSDLRKLPRDDWPDTTVQQSMTPVARLLTVSPSDDLATATALMASGNVHQLPVVEDGRFVGLVTRAEVIQMLRSRDDVARIVGQPEPGSGDSDRAGSAPGDASARHDSKLAASGRTSK